MSAAEFWLILGGFLCGFATADAIYWLRRPTKRPTTVAEGWDQIRHVKVVRK